MKQKNIIRIVLDTIMIIVLVLMYKKSSISMQFHEIGGLILLAAFVVHLLINRGIITAASKRFFAKGFPVKTRIDYIVDFLLLLSFVLIGVSGALISKVVFSFSEGGGVEWKIIHYFCSAFALILIGVHVGLHWKFIGTMYGKIRVLPRKVSAIVGIFVVVALFIYGCYNLSTTSFSKWITMPFSVNQISEHPRINQTSDQGQIQTQIQEQGQDGTQEQNLAASSESGNLLTESDSEVQQIIEVPVAGSNKELGLPHGREQSVSFSGVVLTIVQFFSISFVFSILTWLVEWLLKKKRKQLSPAN